MSRHLFYYQFVNLKQTPPSSLGPFAGSTPHIAKYPDRVLHACGFPLFQDLPLPIADRFARIYSRVFSALILWDSKLRRRRPGTHGSTTSTGQEVKVRDGIRREGGLWMWVYSRWVLM
jgi:hypothetical protein